MVASKRVQLTPCGFYDEGVAAAALKPGHLVCMDTAGKYKKHDVYGGGGHPLCVATEDMNALQGLTIDDAYAADEPISLWYPSRGGRFIGRVPANAAAIGLGTRVISDGAGCVVKPPVSEGSNALFTSLAASTAVSNGVSTEQDFDVTYTLPANVLQVGDILNIKGHAVVSAEASTDTLIVKVYIGATALVATAAVNAAVGDVVSFDLNVVVRTIGASGTFVMFGTNANGVPATGTVKACFLASTAIDTTATKVIKASATWSATSATNTVALQSLVVSLARSGGLGLLAVAVEAIDNSAVATETKIALRAL